MKPSSRTGKGCPKIASNAGTLGRAKGSGTGRVRAWNLCWTRIGHRGFPIALADLHYSYEQAHQVHNSESPVSIITCVSDRRNFQVFAPFRICDSRDSFGE